MRRSLISSSNSLVRNAFGVAATVILLPLGIIAALITAPFSRPLQRTALEVANFLRDFIDGNGGDWDWDDFTSVPIANPKLEAIRLRAIEVEGENSPQMRQKLEQLHSEALALAADT